MRGPRTMGPKLGGEPHLVHKISTVMTTLCVLRTGKTTFLNALSGKAHYGKLSGIVRYNGEVLEPLKVKTLVGYVPQDDIVHEDLTVQENVMMAHALRSGFKDIKDGKIVVDEVRSGSQGSCPAALSD